MRRRKYTSSAVKIWYVVELAASDHPVSNRDFRNIHKKDTKNTHTRTTSHSDLTKCCSM